MPLQFTVGKKTYSQLDRFKNQIKFVGNTILVILHMIVSLDKNIYPIKENTQRKYLIGIWKTNIQAMCERLLFSELHQNSKHERYILNRQQFDFTT